MIFMKFLLAVPFNTKNKGDVAVLNSVITTLLHEYPQSTVVAFVQGPTSSNKADFKNRAKLIKYISPNSLVNSEIDFCFSSFKSFSWAFFRRFFDVPLTKLVKENAEALDAYYEADVVIFPSRDFISSSYGIKPLLSAILLSWIVAKLLNKRMMLYAGQIGPFYKNTKGDFCYLLTSFMLKKMALVTVRDVVSKKRLESMGLQASKIFVTADPAFLLTPIKPDEAKTLLPNSLNQAERPLVGINISDLIYKFGFLNSPTVSSKQAEYVALMAKVIDALVEKLGVNILLIPHVFDSGNDDRVISNLVCLNVVHKENVYLIDAEKEPEELKGIISLCDMFITTRHHPFVHSMSMAVPTIGVEYTFKMRELSRILDYDQWVIDIRDLTTGGLLDKSLGLWSKRTVVKSQLEVKVEELKKRAALNATLIQKVI
jgi:polysaccharide pyruvyl transferase WcaK-like protein